ncbi:MAG: ABC transporter ATP-binding protein [Candidatus Dormibacteraceae bacterium]
MKKRSRWGNMYSADNSGQPSSRHPVEPRRVFRLFKDYRGHVLLATLTILVTSTLGVANPLLIRAVFDHALFCGHGCPNLSLLFELSGIMIAVPIIGSFINVGQTYLTNWVGLRVVRDLRDQLYSHLQTMSLRFFTNTRTGEIQSRLANDVGGVQNVVTNTAGSVVSNVAVVLSTLGAMLWMSWQLTVLSVALVPIFVVVVRRIGAIRKQIAHQAQESKADLTAMTEETLSVSGVLLTKVFDRQGDERERFRQENQKLAKLSIREVMVGQTSFALIGGFFSILPALVYMLAGLTMHYGWGMITAGTIVAFTSLQSRLFFPVGSLLSVVVELQTSTALFSRIFEYLDLPQDIVDREGAKPLSRRLLKGRVELDNVYFRYGEAKTLIKFAEEEPTARREARTWALDGVSLTVEPGQLAAIVGPSGAGKTTISYLIPRLYEAGEGVVSIDGMDVRDIQMASLSEIVGMVTQDSHLFHASIRQNLLYARPDAMPEEMEAAARAAHIHERIMDFPEGYDTVVGERGYRLSGGEKQRLAIARVILKDPRILILDEATSALDTNSERLVQSALHPLMQGRTTIAIAHRLSTILAADVIFVLDRGRIVEQGTHSELIARNGLYADLYRQQFSGGLVECKTADGVVLAGGEVIGQG